MTEIAFIREINPEIQRLLQRIYRQSRHHQVRRRAHCLLLRHQGLKVKQLMDIFPVSYKTIYNWFNAWETRGLLGLYNRPGRGRKPTFNHQQKEQLQAWAQEHPKQLKQVLQKVEQEWGLTISTKTIKRILKTLRMSWHRLRRGEILLLKPQTVNRKLSSLKSFLNWAVREDLLPDHRTPRFPQPIREEKGGPKWLDRQEQHSLLRIVEQGKNQRDITIVKLLLNTGLRVSELCALTWSDIKINSRKGRLIVRSGKGGKRREIPLNKDARKALQDLGYRQHSGETNHVFQGQRGPMTPRGVESMLRKYVAHTPLDEVTPHKLRHTFCKNLIDAGVSLEKVAMLAGHENLETTRRYCSPSNHDLEAAVELIGVED